jgi:hypothetical protein
MLAMLAIKLGQQSIIFKFENPLIDWRVTAHIFTGPAQARAPFFIFEMAISICVIWLNYVDFGQLWQAFSALLGLADNLPQAT